MKTDFCGENTIPPALYPGKWYCSLPVLCNTLTLLFLTSLDYDIYCLCFYGVFLTAFYPSLLGSQPNYESCRTKSYQISTKASESLSTDANAFQLPPLLP